MTTLRIILALHLALTAVMVGSIASSRRRYDRLLEQVRSMNRHSAGLVEENQRLVNEVDRLTLTVIGLTEAHEGLAEALDERTALDAILTAALNGSGPEA